MHGVDTPPPFRGQLLDIDPLFKIAALRNSSDKQLAGTF